MVMTADEIPPKKFHTDKVARKNPFRASDCLFLTRALSERINSSGFKGGVRAVDQRSKKKKIIEENKNQK